MKKISCLSLFVLFLMTFQTVSAQETPPRPMPPKPTPTPVRQSVSTSNLEYLQQTTETPREKREQALAKLLEGQRHIWKLSNSRSQTDVAAEIRSARESLQKAVEFDPTLAEGYTALADLAYKSQPADYAEAIRLANIAVKINPKNFGGRVILARLYTYNSRLNRGMLDKETANKAVEQWKQVASLDPRNAEANAFLSELYDALNQPKEKIAALKNWLSSSQPLDTWFYRGIMGQKDLSPEGALVKLGAALLKENEARESVEILSRAVADNPKNDEAIELLIRAIETSDKNTSALAIESLQQAIFANPENVSLITLLATIQSKAGKLEDATKLLRNSAAKLAGKNKVSAANLQLSLGDILADAEQYDEAVTAYEETLPILGIEDNEFVTDNDREYAAVVYEKIIRAYKNANRQNDAKKVIEQTAILFGEGDLFADRQLVALYRENGQKEEALKAIRAARLINPQDYELLRLESEILTENGKVEEGVGLLKALIAKPDTGNQSAAVQYDDFTNYLYISNLYSQAKRGKEAVEAANQALTIARNEERRRFAKLSLATAYQVSGNFQAAEKSLREILETSPNNPIALNNLGYFLLERNEKIDEALQLIQKAVELAPFNPSFLDSLGWAYFKLNKLDEAEKYLKNAARLDTSSATILEHLGDLYQKQGKTEAAKSSWRKALKISSEREEINRLRTKLGEKTEK